MSASLNGVNPYVVQQYQLASAVFAILTGGMPISWDGTTLKVSGGVVPVVTSGLRTWAEQQTLYDERSLNPYPVNRPGDSAHEFGLAIDSWVPDGYQDLWRQVREYFGFRVPTVANGAAKDDPVHAEVPDWRSYVNSLGITPAGQVLVDPSGNQEFF